MKKHLFTACLSVVAGIGTVNAQTYFNALDSGTSTNTSSNGWPYVSIGQLSAATNYSNGTFPAATTNGINLTQFVDRATGGQGAIYLPNVQYNTAKPLHIEFEFCNWGQGQNDGDGITLMLYKGSSGSGNDTLGADGGAMSYVYERGWGNNPGLRRGYFAIGFDEFGYFKETRNVPSNKFEGMPSVGWNNENNHITLRGPGNPNPESGSIPAWYSGYPVLYTMGVLTNSSSSNHIYGAALVPGNGTNSTANNYSYITTPPNLTPFYLEMGGNATNPNWDSTGANAQNYRKAFIDFTPATYYYTDPIGNTTQYPSFAVTVTIKHGINGGGSTLYTDTIVNNYVMPAVDSLAAYDNLTGVTNYIDATLPSSLYIGIAGTNGDATDFHSIHNLLISGAGGLPITYYNPLTATLKNNTVLLNWATATEINNKGFKVQRSTDGKSFIDISFVASQTANGRSTKTLSYNYTDISPLQGKNYYRLEQEDLDGKSTFSGIAIVDFSGTDGGLNVYPNPAHGIITITGLQVGSKAVIYNTNGQPVKSFTTTAVSQKIDISGFAAGIYFVKVLNGNGKASASFIAK